MCSHSFNNIYSMPITVLVARKKSGRVKHLWLLPDEAYSLMGKIDI